MLEIPAGAACPEALHRSGASFEEPQKLTMRVSCSASLTEKLCGTELIVVSYLVPPGWVSLVTSTCSGALWTRPVIDVDGSAAVPPEATLTYWTRRRGTS
jgi:hypothetical protein